MNNIVRISSKRQITLPARLFRQLNLKEGDQLSVTVNEAGLYLKKAQSQLDALVGSVPLPEGYKGRSLDVIISEATAEYFSNPK